MSKSRFNLSQSLAMKLGCALVHYAEHSSSEGVGLDLIQATGLVLDPEVQAWIEDMGVLLPLPRQSNLWGALRKNSFVPQHGVKRTTLIGAVWEVSRMFTASFPLREIRNAVVKQYPQFKSTPSSSWGSALLRLSEKGEIKIVRHGMGSQGNLYKAINVGR